MEETLRNTLIIVSAIVIGAIFVHGLWTIRKNKNPYKLKAKPEDIQELSSSVDRQGFDQDGIGSVKVVSRMEADQQALSALEDDEIPEQAAPAPDYNESPLPQDVEKKEPELNLSELDQLSEPELSVTGDNVVSIATQKSVSDEGDAQQAEQPEESSASIEQRSEPKPEQKPLYDDPVIQAKPNMRKKIGRAKNAAVKRNQMEMNFGDLESVAVEQQQPSVNKQESLAADVLIVSVVVPEDSVISGAALLPNLLTLGMKYGEMQIFHRHQDNAGNGDSIFSLANWLNPGSFDLDNMETFETRGVSLFMQLPNPEDPFKVFEQMLAAANHLATEFHGQLLDGNRSVFNKQTEQHYLSKIREFERKKRIHQF